MEPRLNRKEVEERELVQPVEVVGDDNVVAGSRDVLPPLHVEPKAQAQQRHPDQPDQPVWDVGPATDRKEVG